MVYKPIMKAKKLASKEENEGRIAIIEEEKCKPKKCQLECKIVCPVNKQEKMCVRVEKTSKCSFIEESLCIGCGQCVRKCPFNAIKIINLPKNLPDEVVHRYGHNKFVLYRLPTPRPNEILGLVGTNGIGKTTALNILTRKETPNLGRIDDPPTWSQVISHFKGTELQSYFDRVVNQNLKCAFKMQLVDQIPKSIRGEVKNFLLKKDQRGLFKELCDLLEMNTILDSDITKLSGGELQRFAIMVTLMQSVNIYIFDEPTSYLDVKQRLVVSKAIRQYCVNDNSDTYTVLVEHDLAILDYLSNLINCLYGVPAVFGVGSLPYSVKEGINVFLEGFLPKENMRFRDHSLNFRNNEWDNEDKEKKPEEEDDKEKDDDDGKKEKGTGDKKDKEKGDKKDKEKGDKKDKEKGDKKDKEKKEKDDEEEEKDADKKDDDKKDKAKQPKPKPLAQKKDTGANKTAAEDEDKEISDQKVAPKPDPTANDEYLWLHRYPKIQLTKGRFNLTVNPGGFTTSQIVVFLGENGTGKTTFVKIMGGTEKDAKMDGHELPKLKVSIKPQTIAPSFQGTVQDLLNQRLPGLWNGNTPFRNVVVESMRLGDILAQEVLQLSGGETQRVALVIALGRPADLYLIDEPSAYLDVEQRIVTAKVIKRFIYMFKKTAFIVEHDFIMSTYLADRFIVFEGTPGLNCTASRPMGVVEGMNKFLSILGITFRRDAQNFRPRINKLNSQLDKEQKASGNYFFIEK